jgi:hypothetical protein
MSAYLPNRSLAGQVAAHQTFGLGEVAISQFKLLHNKGAPVFDPPRIGAVVLRPPGQDPAVGENLGTDG